MAVIVEATFKGMSQAAIGEQLNMTDRTVRRELARAGREGVIDRVRDRMLETLEQVPDVLSTILTTDVKELHAQSRGYKLKLDAANSLSTGLGAYRTETLKKTEVSLAAIAAEASAPSEIIDGTPHARLAFRPSAASSDGLILPDDPDFRDIPDSPSTTLLLKASSVETE